MPPLQDPTGQPVSSVPREAQAALSGSGIKPPALPEVLTARRQEGRFCRGQLEIRWRQHDAGCEIEQRAEAAAVERHVLHEAVVNQRAHRGVGCVQINGIRDDGDVLSKGADLELDVMFQMLLHVDGDSGQAGEFEPRLFSFHAIMARMNAGKSIKSAISSCSLGWNATLYVNEANCRVGDDSAGRISDRIIDGFEAEKIDKIFESFYTTKPGGIGMGLSISRSILQAHGGRLWATAKDGAGTIFHFTLPKYHDEASHAEV